MSKRFTETTKWNDPWFRKLAPEMKLAFLYLVDNCDNAGVLDLDRDLADFQIGFDVDWETFFTKAGDRVEQLQTGAVWVVRFVEFQQKGTLSERCKPHQQIIELLKKHGIYGRVVDSNSKGSVTLSEGLVKGTGKGKGKGNSQVKEKGKRPTVDEVAAYCRERNNQVSPQAFVDFYTVNGWVQGKGKPIRDWKACIRTWERNNGSSAANDSPMPTLGRRVSV